MTTDVQIPPEFVSLFSNKDFIETMKGISLYLAKEDASFRKDLTAVLVPDIKATIRSEIKESYSSPEFTGALESGLSTLDIFCNIPRRILDLEYAVGIRECDPDEEDEHASPVRIQTLEDKIENVSFGASESSAIEIKQKTKTGKRAVALIKALIDSGKDHLTRAQIRKVLSDKDNKELGDARITEDASNPRRDISNALDEAERICSKVRCDKKNYGRHERRLLKA